MQTFRPCVFNSFEPASPFRGTGGGETFTTSREETTCHTTAQNMNSSLTFPERTPKGRLIGSGTGMFFVIYK